MRPGTVIFGAAVSVALLIVAGVLYSLSGDGSGEHHRRSVDLVRQIQLASSDWSAEITRVRSNPFADFDTLAAFIPQMARLKQDLTDEALRIPDLPDRITADVQAYLNAIEAKEERIERFKTGYAVVRNSSRYLPLAATNVLQLAQGANDPVLRQRISGLTRDINLFLATPTPTTEARLKDEIERLRGDSVAYTPDLANALANLLAHADVLVSRQGPTEELFRLATSDEIADLTDNLVRSLEFERSRADLATTRYQQGVLAVIGVLVVFWALLALQQRVRSSRAAATAGQQEPSVAAAPARAQPSLAAPAEQTTVAAEPTPSPRSPRTVRDTEPFPSAVRAAEPALLHGFVVQCIAGTLATSTDEIVGRMEFLGRTQLKIHEALETGDAGAMFADGANLKEEIDSIAAIAQNVRQKMNGFADLAKRLESVAVASPADRAARSMISVNTCIEDVIAATGAERRASIVKSLGDIPEIFASEGEFRLLLAEVIENSLLAVQDLADRQGIVKIETAQKNGDILITVIDNGAGIAPEMRTQIFKPFFTSREDAIGIGLTLAGHLAKQYEGVIKINSLLGQGTVARITLPASIAGP